MESATTPNAEVAPTPAAAELGWLRWAAVGVARWLVAAALLAAAAAKLDAGGGGPFLREVESTLLSLGVEVRLPTVTGAATLVLLAELTIGVALLIGWHTRSSAAIAAGLLTVFLAVLIWRLATEGPVSCTCFGDWWVRSPRVALATDVLLLLAAAAAAALSPRIETEPRWKNLLVVSTAALSVVGLSVQLIRVVPPEQITVGEDVRRLDLPGPTTPEAAPSAAESEASPPPSRLVVVIDTQCSRCRGQWELIHRIATDPALPPCLVATVNGPDEAIVFRSEFGLSESQFPLPPIVGPARYRFRTTKPPILLWIRNGRVLGLWKNFLPQPADIAAEIQRQEQLNAGPLGTEPLGTGGQP